MVMAYFMAQLMPWATDGDATTAGGSLLVLGSANVDEALRGYYTKYDCSAADINPIGGINKRDLKTFLEWAGEAHHFPVLRRVAGAQPSAELTGAEGAQMDEEDMGMSYAELGDLGHCRKVRRLFVIQHPVSFFFWRRSGTGIGSCVEGGGGGSGRVRERDTTLGGREGRVGDKGGGVQARTYVRLRPGGP
jgi:NH3-dependent NAD+ synthetase